MTNTSMTNETYKKGIPLKVANALSITAVKISSMMSMSISNGDTYQNLHSPNSKTKIELVYDAYD